MISKELLKYYREKNNYDIASLAKKLKCPKKLVELWEAGSVEPNELDVDALCNLYNIEKRDLMFTKNNLPIEKIIIALIFFIIGIIEAMFMNNNYFYMIVPAVNVILYLIGSDIFSKYKNKLLNTDNPTSLFSIRLSERRKDRKILYYEEANLISLLYISINIICRLFDIDKLVLNINIVDNKYFNDFVIIILLYVSLMIISYTIELIFGEIMMKKYKEGSFNGRKEKK